MAQAARGLSALDLASDGAQLHRGAALSILALLEELCTGAAPLPGIRLAEVGALGPHLSAKGCIGSIAASVVPDARPVRAVAFDKSPGVNWALGWHQDRTIALRQRCEVPGFSPWTCKAGVPHAEPPFALIAAMVTLRIHLDYVDEENAPLRIALGSHEEGLVAQSEIPAVLARGAEAVCLARPGDVWAYRTPILHASERSRSGARRRVLQVDYSADRLPPPLEWALEA